MNRKQYTSSLTEYEYEILLKFLPERDSSYVLFLFNTNPVNNKSYFIRLLALLHFCML